jgi:glucose/arabinose dehydrogenase
MRSLDAPCQLALLLLLALAACAPAPSSLAPAAPRQPIADGPTLLRDDIALRRVADAGTGAIRLALHPDGDLFVLHPGSGLSRIDPTSGAVVPVASVQQLVGAATPAGMAFGPDGQLYVVANRASGTHTQGLVRRGAAASDAGWTTLAETAPYALSGTQFDHGFNGVVVSPDGAWVFVNSGSRTDHGEIQTNNGAFPDAREGQLTARIFRFPADATDLRIPDDAGGSAPYVYARGLRNAYDLAFAPNGELFAVDNGPDADLADELNLIRAGQHYGFPWRFGVDPNPVLAPGFDPRADGRLSQDFAAVQRGLYQPDPDFPAPPAAFVDPVANDGPAAAVYRSADGKERDAAAEGAALHTFTPHRSPLGLLFANSALPTDLRGDSGRLSAFVLSWGAAGGDLRDQGQDLLHMALRRQGEGYRATTVQIARDFKRPIDAVLIDNKLYVLEFDGASTIWELSFG